MADIDRRSEDRQAEIRLRMSPAEKAALFQAADEYGLTVNDLVRERVSDLIGAGT